MSIGWKIAIAAVAVVVATALVSTLATAYLFRPPAFSGTVSESR